MSLKILILSKSYPIYGGVERWLADLSVGLTGKGHDCRVALANGRDFHNAHLYAQAYPKLRWFKLDSKTGSPIGRQIAVAKSLLTFRPDIVVPIMLADGLCVAAQFKSLLEYLLVYPIHQVGRGEANDLQWFGELIDLAVAVDRTSEDLIVKSASDSPRIVVIPSGVPVNRHPPVRRSGGVLRILYCGRLHDKGKRVTDLVGVINELEKRNIAYHMTISGGGNMQDFLKKKLIKYIESGKVLFTGFVDRDILYAEIYPQSDVLLFTSEWETGPLVAFEAMMHSCVIVTSDFTGRSENNFLRHGENSMVFPVGDVLRAVDHLELLSRDNALAKALGKKGRYDAYKEKNLYKMVNAWDSLLTSCRGKRDVSFNIQGFASNLFDRRNTLALEIVRELARKMTGRSFAHGSPGEEWPSHCLDGYGNGSSTCT